MHGRSRRTRRTYLIGACVLVLACLGAGMIAVRKDVAIAYHRRAMARARSEIDKLGPSFGKKDEHWAKSFVGHRDALVRYGYLIRREFPLPKVRSQQSGRVFRQLVAECPDIGDVVVETTPFDVKKPVAIVWDRPCRMSIWEAAIRRLDVPGDGPSVEVTTNEGRPKGTLDIGDGFEGSSSTTSELSGRGQAR